MFTAVSQDLFLLSINCSCIALLCNILDEGKECITLFSVCCEVEIAVCLPAAYVAALACSIDTEVLAEAGTQVSADLADMIQNAAVPFVYIQTEERNVKVLSNMMVELTSYVDCDPKELGITELVYYPVLEKILEEYAEDPEELAEAIKKNVNELIPKHITKEDIFASINYNMHLEYGLGKQQS